MAIAGYLESNFTSIHDNRLRFECECTSYDRENLTANVSWRVYVISKNGFTNETIKLEVDFGINTQLQVNKTYSCAAGDRILVGSGTYNNLQFSNPYDSSEIESVSISGIGSSIDINSITYKDCTVASPFPFASILSAPTSINDEAEDITFSLSVPKPSGTSSLRVGIDFGAGYSYTTLSSNTSAFTYALTQSDYIAIYEHNTVQSFTISVIIESTVDGYEYQRTKEITCKFVNAEPTFTVDIVDENTTMGNLTGDAVNKFVRGYSDAQVTIISSPKKGAEILSEVIICGNQTLDGSGTIYGVESSEFVITVTDSRGFTTTQTIYKQLVNYITLTCNLEVDIPSSSGSTVAKISGNCFYGSFGNLTNNLTISYRYRTDSSYGDWQSATVTINDNNTYSVNYNITGLDYTKTYTFEAIAADRIEQVSSVEVKVKSTPVFDWSENDFNFNVPVNFSNGFTQPVSALKQLWNGNFQMESSSVSIPLSESILDQPNGIVLIFTPWNKSTNLANDEKLQSFFISKKTVQTMRSKLHTFFLSSGADFGTIGAKSLYIGYDVDTGESRITGYATNDDSGTKNGITFDNTQFVLRYVLGV